MTDTPTIERETLWVTDAELIRRLGVPERQARQALRMMDRQPGYGFPKKDPIWGGRRYWPAVKAYFEKTQAPRIAAPTRRAS
jgi:hypothetical protein